MLVRIQGELEEVYSGAVNAEENVTASATPYRIPKKTRNPALILVREKGSTVNNDVQFSVFHKLSINLRPQLKTEN